MNTDENESKIIWDFFRWNENVFEQIYLDQKWLVNFGSEGN